MCQSCEESIRAYEQGIKGSMDEPVCKICGRLQSTPGSVTIKQPNGLQIDCIHQTSGDPSKGAR